jgi:hypothetical protein
MESVQINAFVTQPNPPEPVATQGVRHFPSDILIPSLLGSGGRDMP